MKIFEALQPDRKTAFSKAEISGNSVVAYYSDGIELIITLFLGGDSYELDNFNFTLFYTPFIGEQEVIELAVKGSSSTIGYIFPISSLSGTSTVGKNESKWLKVYARACSLSLAVDGLGSFLLTPIDITKFTQSYDITDIFPNNIAVLVTGKSNLEANKYSHSEAILMLQEFGFAAILRPQAKNDIEQLTFLQKLKVSRISKSLIQNIQHINEIIILSKEISNPIGRFISLYQIIELIIQKIFEHSINELISSGISSPWDVRERLQDIVNEKWRISQINSKYVKSDGTGSIINSFVSDAKVLLANIASETGYKETDNDWVSLLYLIRNTVVHRQHLVVNRLEANLQAVCVSLEGVCYYLLKCVEIPQVNLVSEQGSN